MHVTRFGIPSAGLCWFTLLCAGSLLSCDGYIERPKSSELRELVLREPSPEEQSAQLLSQPRYSHREMLERIAAVAHDPEAKGLFLQVGEFGSAWARSAELRRALLTVRAAKKPVHCYFEETDNVGYALLASVCDRISMTPTGMLSLVGVHAQLVYAKELLDLVGVRADLMQVGRFKGAADPLTRTDMPAEVKETMGALLDALQANVTQAVTEGRKLDAAAFTAALSAGPQTPKTALRLRLVDAVSFDDEARAKAKAAAKAEHVVVIADHPEAPSGGLFDLLKALTSSDDDDKPKGKHLALAYLRGTIGNGEEEGGSGVNAGPFIKAMHGFADDEDVAALVVRIDSPGGSALASDRMWHALRRVAKRKPVIVSIGDMAASGGYYVACAATEIFAEDTSLVGSIGVVGGKIVFQDIAARAGVRIQELTRGQNAGWMSPMQPFTDSERAAVREAMEDIYRTFIARVSEGRHRTPAQLADVVEGRIMSGARAREGGLVDSSGGLTAALDHARAKAGVDADTELEVWPNHHSILERVTHVLSGTDTRALAGQGVGLALSWVEGSGLASSLVRGERGPFATLPYGLSIR